ncbi:DNA (cytosine-5-)-methyltransferase [Helcococcus bovis]|uniref:DNA cytosine methyltransferase n=1 Tax=Helcococcus bovis TaxID=3153252 RepID=UPI0038BDAF6D
MKMGQMSLEDYWNEEKYTHPSPYDGIIPDKKRVLSLFSGAGGMDIGFEGDFLTLKRSINETMHPSWIREDYGEWVKVAPTNFETVFANDIRPDAKAAWVGYFEDRKDDANSIYRLESIVELVKKAKKGEKIFPEDINIVTGGFPCQDFSVAGNRKGFKSDKSHSGGKLDIDEPTIENRGQLYIWMREVISIVEPEVFIAENVKGLVSLEDAKEIIEHDFSNAGSGGYIVVPAKVLHAADYGVPQSRERIIFFGFKRSALKPEAKEALENFDEDSIFNPYPTITHSFNIKSEYLKAFVRTKEALNGLKEPNESKDLSQTKYSKAKYLPKGQGNIEIKLDSIAPTIRAEHHGNIEFRRLSAENGGVNNEELDLGLEQRRLTVRECARLQTFPDEYQFILDKTDDNVALSASNAYKIIGNAVPVVLAYNIAKTLSEKWGIYFKN